MYTDAVTTAGGEEIPEGILDAMVTSFAAMHDLQGDGPRTNSKTGSIYIVKPKFHGPEEVDMTIRMFEWIESALGLRRIPLRLGLWMRSDGRPSISKKRSESHRNGSSLLTPGFLDRTGDEIHTSMEAGPVIPKMDIRNEPWMLAYEDWNVDIGIETALLGTAQIGRGCGRNLTRWQRWLKQR